MKNLTVIMENDSVGIATRYEHKFHAQLVEDIELEVQDEDDSYVSCYSTTYPKDAYLRIVFQTATIRINEGQARALLSQLTDTLSDPNEDDYQD